MTQPKLQVKNCDLFYGDFQALHFAKGQKLATLKQSALLNAPLWALA